ncbi:cytochrome P450 monooxygenase [Biscogniauxia marginata]|nr:cytochrome P450 monooxygenase [Biscogniauxia marginata]
MNINATQYLEPLHTLTAIEWSTQVLLLLPVVGLLFVNLLHTIHGRLFGVKAKVVGYRSFCEPGWLLGFRFVRGSAPIIRDGYQEFKNSMFKVRRNDGEILIISNKHADKLRNMPEEHVSAIGAHIKNLLGRFSTTTIMLESDLPIRVLQQKLTPSLNSTIPLLGDELDYALGVEVPHCKDGWVNVQIHDIILRIVARVSARVFLGPSICRNEEWLHTSIHYTENVFTTVMTLRIFPSFLHGLIAPLLPSYWRIHANLRTAKRIISPIVRERRAAAARQGPNYEKASDLLQSMMDIAEPHESHPDKLAHRQLLLSLASIHTTTMAIAHAIYDLCANPQYFEPLREELFGVPGEEVWQKITINKFRRLDSFLKESQRMNPPSLLAFNRLVRAPLRLADGTVLPPGTHFSMASDAILHDAEQLPGGGDPEQFDPFRYVRLREDPKSPENLSRFQFAMTDTNSLHFGHGKFACPGRFFASNEIKIILIHLLLRYELRYPEGQGRPQNLSVDENIYPDPSARVLIRARQEAAGCV